MCSQEQLSATVGVPISDRRRAINECKLPTSADKGACLSGKYGAASPLAPTESPWPVISEAEGQVHGLGDGCGMQLNAPGPLLVAPSHRCQHDLPAQSLGSHLRVSTDPLDVGD